MAIVLKDRVKQTAAAPGTGTITLGATVAGFQAFSAIGNGNVTYFAIVDPVSGAWEVNYGTYTSSGTTLSRNATPLSSSAAGALVNFTGAVDVFCTYPSEKAIYEETGGNVLIDGGPITVVGNGVTSYTTFSAALGELYGNINSFAQFYAQNLNDGTSASTDIVAYNDLGDGVNNFIDMGINSSNYTDAAYPIFTAGSGYVYNDGGELIIGSATDDVLLFAGGIATTDWAARIDKTTKSLTTKADVNVGGALDVTGNAVFGGTVTLDANPTTALQAATKQYVDNQVTAGLHIHEPVRVETTGNLTATYAQGGTTFNITDITSGTTVTTSASHGLVVNDQIWLYSTAGNGLSTNTAYFVFSTPAANQLTLSLTFDGTQITGLTNASGLTYATRANSGVGATLTNSGAQAALTVDGVALSLTNRVMVRLQTNGAENGVYTVTTVGSGSTNWVLTRATDNNTVNPANPDGLGTGDYFFTQEGTLNAGDSHVLTTEPNTMIIGYTPLTYTQFSGSVDYTGGTNITVAGQTISVSGTIAATLGGTGTSTVATGDLLYGSGTNTWGKLAAGAAYKTLSMNAGGTNVEWNAVALDQSAAVSGALGPTNGGTGLSTYTLGDTVYSSAANTLAKLAGNTTTTKKFLVQTGTGSVSAAPSWDVVNGADVNGNISGSAGSVANALTAGSYLTSAGTFNGAAARTFAVDATDANTASKVVARDASGNFSAGTITAALSGNATTATTATNVAGGAANRIPYNTASGTTGFIVAPTTGSTFLSWNGSAFVYSAISTPNALTMNSSGTGAVSGTTFNGSAAQTISYNTIGASPLAGSTSLTTTGTVTTGTWSGLFGAVSGANLTSLTAANLSGTVAVANGGTASSTAGGARTNLGATTLGGNLFTITNPSAVTFPRFNADNTVSSLDAATFRSAIGAGTSSTTGTVTSIVASTYLTGGTITTSGTIAVDATSANTASKVVARDASGNFSAGTITATLSGNASTATSATTAGSITSQANSATITATSANTANQIVLRDASGNFSAGTITAALSGNATTSSSTTGNAATATTLQTARTINGTSFNGSANITITANTTNTLTLGSYLTGTSFNGSAAVTAAVDATTAATASKVVARDASGYVFAVYYNATGTFPVTASANTSGMGTFTGTNGTDNYGRGYTAAAAATLLSGQTMNIAGSATTFTSTSQNSQFNSVGVGTAGSGTAGEIRATNNITAYYSSDIKFKENVRDIPNAAVTAAAIGGKLFDWKAEYIEEHGGEDGYFIVKSDFGVIAQDVLAKFPVAVRTRPDGSLAVDYEKLSALALAANAEHEVRIAKLEALVAKLIEG